MEVELDSVSAPFAKQAKRLLVGAAAVISVSVIVAAGALLWGVIRIADALDRGTDEVRRQAGAAWHKQNAEEHR